VTWSTCSTYPTDLRFRLSIGRSRTGLNWISITKPNYPSALAHWKLVLETSKLYSYLFKHGLHINNYHIRYLTQHIDFDHLYKGQETSLEGKGKQLLLPTRLNYWAVLQMKLSLWLHLSRSSERHERHCHSTSPEWTSPHFRWPWVNDLIWHRRSWVSWRWWLKWLDWRRDLTKYDWTRWSWQRHSWVNELIRTGLALS
jgi:hypothetical protein